VSRTARLVLGLGALAGLAALLVWGVGGLPDYGHPRGPYADLAPKIMLDERHVTNAVTGVTFDLRGFDTLGEELILFVAALGAAVLLRAQRSEEESAQAVEAEERRRPQTSSALRALGAVLVGPVLLLGVYAVVHGALTPGGGFQGGVIVAGALIMAFLGGRYLMVKLVAPHALVEAGEAAGAAGYAFIGIGGLVFAGVFFRNFLALCTSGQLLSAGTMPLSNIAVGLEVAGAFVLLWTEFLDQALLIGGE
jgi:multicomponent Na+:H+ antiporter subunit B